MKLSVDDMEVEVELSDTIESVKAKIQEISGIQAPRQVLELADRELENGKILSDYSIQDNANLQFSIRLLTGRRLRFIQDTGHLARESFSRQGWAEEVGGQVIPPADDVDLMENTMKMKRSVLARVMKKDK